jgi:hypothetical protein
MSETDNLARGNHVVPTEWAQKLERERDEARELADRYRVALCSANGDKTPTPFPWEEIK